jgi:hypothetical protein
MLAHPEFALAIEDVVFALNVGAAVKLRLFQTGPDPRPSREIDHGVERIRRKDLFQPRPVLDVGMPETESFQQPQPCEAPLLQPDIIVVVEIVDAHNDMSVVEQ